MVTYNIASHNSDHMNELVENISGKIKHGCSRGDCYYKHKITYQDVRAAVGKIKEHKYDVNDSFNSDHIVYECHVIMLLC